jgi:hypothetical protein
LVFEWNPRTVILDFNRNLVGVTNSNAYGDDLANRRILHGVVEYVDQRLPQKKAVALDLGVFVAFKNEA